MKLPETFPNRNSALLDQLIGEARASLPEIGDGRDRIVAAASDSPTPLDFAAGLQSDRVALIAEVKRRSPSGGSINEELNPVTLARAYQGGGAAAISVLTEQIHFGGSLADLALVGDVVDLPLLRKDFIVDPIQLYQARAAGAAAVLLIVRALSDQSLGELLEQATELGMAALVEVHDRPELDRALAGGAAVIGVNARNLDDFSIDVEAALELVSRVPSDRVAVAESAMATGADVECAAAAGADAVLIGSALARSRDPEALARELSGIRRRGR